jgi:hypothetical protein
MAEQEKYEPPKPTKSDKVHIIARAGLQVIPGVGGAVADFFNAIINPPLEKRRQKWMEDIAEGLRALEAEQNINLEELSSNETFVTTLMQASQAAIRNHQQEKLEALRNVVLNSALPDAPDESLQQMFLNFVDVFTTWHIRLLKLFDNPVEDAKAKGLNFGNLLAGGLSIILEGAFPELKDRREFYDQVWKDLHSRSLVGNESLHGTMSASGLMASRTTR